jgi:uncharacterized SAM-binding protein YcdF (DUF218 family)
MMSKRILVVVLLGIIAILLVRSAGSFLVVNAPEPSDVIVVMGGGEGDLRYWNGVRLMQEGHAHHLLLNVFSRGEIFGHSEIDLARDFLNRTSPGQSTVCPVQLNSTYDEANYVAQCLEGSGVKSILLVTSAYHSRRALAILQRRLPQYHFSVYAADDPFYFGTRWWTNREWAKTTLAEWQRYLWWLFVDQWRSGLVLHERDG